jgi:hypothetical protein
MNMQVDLGTLIIARATGERGVVVRRPAAGIVQVAFPDGVRLIHLADLDLAPQEPDRLLLEGSLGPSEAYGLRLQALDLQHAYCGHTPPADELTAGTKRWWIPVC